MPQVSEVYLCELPLCSPQSFCHSSRSFGWEAEEEKNAAFKSHDHRFDDVPGIRVWVVSGEQVLQ
jgi:hypothetical protein